MVVGHVLMGSNPISGIMDSRWIDYVLRAPIYCINCRVPMQADVNLLCQRPFAGSYMKCSKCSTRVEQEDLPRPE